MNALSLLLSHLCADVLLPLCRLLFGFLLCGSVGKLQTESLAGSLKNLYAALLGAASAIIGAVLTFQNAIGTAADSAGLRAAKFAVGQMLPMVGSTVSGSLSALSASLRLTRATAGGGVVAVILLSVLPPMAELLLCRLILSFSSSVAELLGAESAKKLYTGFCGIFDLCLAALGICAVLFLFITGVFMKCAAAGGGI